MFGFAAFATVFTTIAAVAVNDEIKYRKRLANIQREVAEIQREGDEKFKAMLNAWRAEKGLEPVE